MNVLSLFDGISCGQVALERAGVQVDKYYASEIDKYAIQITQKNYPNTIQLGDVNGFDSWDLPRIDLIIGGSPCQDLSIAKQDRQGLDGARSGLFWRYVDCIKKFKPKYFLLENVASMPNKAKEIITEALGVEPILINSALVSAQQRKRLYWTNIPNIKQPEDKGILLKDILLSGLPYLDKSQMIGATYNKASAEDSISKHQKPMVAEAIRIPEYGYKDKSRPLGAYYSNNCGGFLDRMNSPNPAKQQVDMIAEPVRLGGLYNQQTRWGIYDENGKSPTLVASMGMGGGFIPMIPIKYCNDKNLEHLMRPYGSKGHILGEESEKSPTILSAMGMGGGNGVYFAEKDVKTTNIYKVENGKIFIREKEYDIKLPDGYYAIRKLYPVECERLQTLPDGYTEGVSNSQRYKAIGNGWTVDVIAHIFKAMIEWDEEEKVIDYICDELNEMSIYEKMAKDPRTQASILLEKYTSKICNMIGEKYGKGHAEVSMRICFDIQHLFEEKRAEIMAGMQGCL